MQSVKERWYIIYGRVATALAVLLVIACIAGLFVPGLKLIAAKWALSYITLSISVVQILYFLLFYKSEANQNSYWSATLFLGLIQTLNIINLIHNTGRLHSWYLIAWGIMLLVMGMFGNYALIGASFLVTIYFVLITTDALGKTKIDIYSVGSVFGSYVIAALSYLLWRNYYVDHASAEVAKLSGALKSKQQQTEILIQSITDGMVVINTEGKINSLNPAAATMTEWPAEEAVGIDVQLVLKLARENGEDIPAADNPFVQVLTKKEPINVTLQLIGRSGKHHVVSLVISPVLLPKTKEFVGAVAVVRDVSTSRAEEQRRADFISTASHEMRTPVAAIEGYLALALNDKVAKVDNNARSYLEKAHSSTQNLGKLFQDLLTSAKAEDGRLVNHPQVVDMGTYLEQLADSLRFSAEKKGLLMEFIIGVNNKDNGGKVIKPLYYVYTDPERMREVITNLFDNAVKYTEAGKISVGLTGNDELVQIYIKDTGPGIAAEDIPHLFQKFYRVDNSATRTIGGTGLGLFICRKIIELYSGRIWAESQVGHGSTFYINLPRLSSQKAATLQATEAASLGSLPVSSANGP